MNRPPRGAGWGLAAAAVALVSAFAQQPLSTQFPTPLPSPSASPPVLTPLTLISPTPSPTPWPTPSATPSPTPSVSPSPTPLPDGEMPLAPPPMPTPVPLDASTLSDQLNLPPPAPPQISEPLASGSAADKLKESEKLAMQQKMIMADFEKSLAQLIAKQRNPNVPDLTLDGAVQIALRQNPNILNAIQQIRLTRGQLITVIAQAVPQVGLATSFNQQAEDLARGTREAAGGTSILTLPNPNGGPPLVGTITTTPNNDVQNQTWSVQFQATQLIFDGGATIAGIAAGTAALDSAYYSLRATIDNIVAQIITQFYQVVLNRALIVAQEQNVALLQQQVQDQQNRYEAGTVPRFNVLQAEVQLANAKPPLIQAENNYRISLYQLVQLLGMDYPQGHPSEVPFNVVGTLGYSPRGINTDESIRVAVARNPALKAQRETILTQAANVNVQIAGWLPTIRANAGYQWENDLGSMNLVDTVEGWFFGATGNWNIWDGGATYGNVAQAKAQLMQAKNNYDNSVRQVVLNVQTAISNLQQAKETIDSTTASVVQATEALRLSRERLDAGAGTQLDVLNAQTQLLTAQTNVLQARYDYISSMASYDQALSLDTQYVETFDDPLTRPLNPQALKGGERKRFQTVTNPKRADPKLPRAFRKNDPVKPILEGAPSPAPSPASAPSPKPKRKKTAGGIGK